MLFRRSGLDPRPLSESPLREPVFFFSRLLKSLVAFLMEVLGFLSGGLIGTCFSRFFNSSSAFSLNVHPSRVGMPGGFLPPNLLSGFDSNSSSESSTKSSPGERTRWAELLRDLGPPGGSLTSSSESSWMTFRLPFCSSTLSSWMTWCLPFFFSSRYLTLSL